MTNKQQKLDNLIELNKLLEQVKDSFSKAVFQIRITSFKNGDYGFESLKEEMTDCIKDQK